MKTKINNRLKNRFKNRFVMKDIYGTDLEYRYDYDADHFKCLVIAILARKERAEEQSRDFFFNLFGNVHNNLELI